MNKLVQYLHYIEIGLGIRNIRNIYLYSTLRKGDESFQLYFLGKYNILFHSLQSSDKMGERENNLSEE